LAIAFAHLPALAQTDDQRAAARALATEGASAFNEGRYKDSADLFSRAESLLHAPPHLLFLARSRVKLGQFVRAREDYLKIVKEPLAANAPAAFKDAQAAAQDELRGVEPRIAKLTIVLDGADAKDATVKVDGNVVPSVLVGVPQPVDPGEHHVDATAAGKRARTQSVTLKDGERQSLTVKLEPDATANNELPPPTPVGGSPGVTAPPPGSGVTLPASGAAPLSQPLSAQQPPEPDRGSSNGLRVGSYIALGVGAVGVVGGVVFLASGLSKQSQSDDLYKQCTHDACDDSDPRAARVLDMDKQAKNAKTLSLVSFIVGGVGLGVGIPLFIVSSRSGSSSTQGSTPSIQPWIGLNSLGLRGKF